MDQLINVKGLSELNKFLQELPIKVERNILRGALRAAAKPILDEAKALCPVGDPSSEGKKIYKLYRGALRDSLRIGTKSNGGRVTASIKAGGKLKNGAEVFYAHMIEFTGAVPHTESGKNRKHLSFGGQFFQSVEHPGMSSKPFLRPSLDGQASNAVIAAANYMKERLATKEGIDTSYIMIEGDE